VLARIGEFQAMHLRSSRQTVKEILGDVIPRDCRQKPDLPQQNGHAGRAAG
jgi:hypothetical protein